MAAVRMIDSYRVEPASVSVITRHHCADNRIFFEGDEYQVVYSPLGGDHLTRVVMQWIIREYALQRSMSACQSSFW